MWELKRSSWAPARGPSAVEAARLGSGASSGLTLQLSPRSRGVAAVLLRWSERALLQSGRRQEGNFSTKEVFPLLLTGNSLLEISSSTDVTLHFSHLHYISSSNFSLAWPMSHELPSPLPPSFVTLLSNSRKSCSYSWIISLSDIDVNFAPPVLPNFQFNEGFWFFSFLNFC